MSLTRDPQRVRGSVNSSLDIKLRPVFISPENEGASGRGRRGESVFELGQNIKCRCGCRSSTTIRILITFQRIKVTMCYSN